MKLIKYIFTLLFILFLGGSIAHASEIDKSQEICVSQEDSLPRDTSKTYVVTTAQDAQFIGKIVVENEREIIIVTKNKGRVAIPKYQIKSIAELKESDLSAEGKYVGNETFHTRYFFTTNALPLKRGDNYVMYQLFGPEVHFGLTDNFGIGIMTSWIASPLVVTPKYSMKLGGKTSFAVGALLGTGGWVVPDFAFALPFGALTFGGEKSNINLSAGYGVASGSTDGVTLMSVGAMAKLTRRSSLIFDGVLLNINEIDEGVNNNGFFTVGLRIHKENDKAVQFGFMGLLGDSEVLGVPIPTVSWFQKF